MDDYYDIDQTGQDCLQDSLTPKRLRQYRQGRTLGRDISDILSGQAPKGIPDKLLRKYSDNRRLEPSAVYPEIECVEECPIKIWITRHHQTVGTGRAVLRQTAIYNYHGMRTQIP